MSKINADTMLIDLLRIDEGTADILMDMGMHCLGCALAHGETVGQAAMVHGHDPEELVNKLNAYIESKGK